MVDLALDWHSHAGLTSILSLQTLACGGTILDRAKIEPD
jgi:hypothetical protein